MGDRFTILLILVRGLAVNRRFKNEYEPKREVSRLITNKKGRRISSCKLFSRMVVKRRICHSIRLSLLLVQACKGGRFQTFRN